MRLHVDWTRCDGHGSCAELLPELLSLDEWGFPMARDGRDPEIPDEIAGAARRAVSACPLQALRLLDPQR